MTMDLKEIKTRILDELSDAVSYMEKAVEHKCDEWGNWFCQISMNEVEHANILLKIFNKTEKPETLTEADHKLMYKEIMESYTDNMSKIETMKKLFWSR